MYPDFEDLILQRQEETELSEDADDLEDECSTCPLRMSLTGRICDMECILWRRQQEDINR